MTSSVTVCSTCSRGLTSRKTIRRSPVGPGTRPWPGRVAGRAASAAAAACSRPRGGRRSSAGRGRDLDQLLPAPLQAAVAVAEHGHAPRRRRRPAPRRAGPGAAAARRRPGRRRRPRAASEAHRSQRLGELGRVRVDRPQAAPAAAGHRLDHDRAGLAQQGAHLPGRGRSAVGAGEHRHAELDAPGRGPRPLSPNSASVVRPGPDEAQPGLGAPARRARRSRTGNRSRGAPRRSPARPRPATAACVEVGRRTGAGQLRPRVGPADVQRRRRRRRGRPPPSRCRARTPVAQDADRDLAPVGDQQRRMAIRRSVGALQVRQNCGRVTT